MAALPIAGCKKELMERVMNSDRIVIVGETGSGKTTQLPQYLHKAGLTKNGPILITQPRRVAAISVAQRVAEEMHCALGGEVGYQVRFDNCSSDATRIKYVTDGTLLRECLQQPELSAYSAVILDEAHIRSLDTDILFGLVKRYVVDPPKTLNGSPRPKIIVMSATLQSDKFAAFFKCDVFWIPGRLYPVEIVYSPPTPHEDQRTTLSYVSKAIEATMRIHQTRPQGDILVFLTGRDEIEKACDELFRRSEELDYRHDVDDPQVTGMTILPVYGALATEMQRRIFCPAPAGTRKVVVSTDIASTSLTIDGIVYVVDSGFVKQKMFNPRTGLDSLQVVPISVSEANQRAGRAGRVRPGECYRLFSKAYQDSEMHEYTAPEIQRTSLTQVVLTLKTLGINDILGFAYLDAPDEDLVLAALRQLYYLNALDEAGKITKLGKSMSALPLTPALSRCLLFSASRPSVKNLLILCAMLSVENIFIRPGQAEAQQAAIAVHASFADRAGDDFNLLIYIYKTCSDSERPRDWCREHFVHFRAIQSARQIAVQLEQILEKEHAFNTKFAELETDAARAVVTNPDLRENLMSECTAVRYTLCFGFFGNIARKAERGRTFHTMNGHASAVQIHPSSVLASNTDDLSWVLYLEVVWTAKAFMKTVCPIAYAWVKGLLPKIHEVDAHALGGSVAPAARASSLRANTTESPAVETSDVCIPAADGTVEESGRRNTKDDIAKAKERYLERKRARGQ